MKYKIPKDTRILLYIRFENAFNTLILPTYIQSTCDFVVDQDGECARMTLGPPEGVTRPDSGNWCTVTFLKPQSFCNVGIVRYFCVRPTDVHIVDDAS